MCSLVERRILEDLPAWSGPAQGSHRLLLLVAPDGISTIERLSLATGSVFKDLGPEGTSNGLRELTWNHTTLHMRSVDPEWTYLQMLLPQPENETIDFLNSCWGEDLLWHLESVCQHGMQRLAALPVVRWRGLDSLEKLMKDCKDSGAVLFNPHVITV